MFAHFNMWSLMMYKISTKLALNYTIVKNEAFAYFHMRKYFNVKLARPQVFSPNSKAKHFSI